MKTAAKTAILKFGGTSLATPELREVAALRVKEAKARGLFPVAVVSAMGRQPDAYATDTLLRLSGRAGTRNADLLLACGETIAAAVFASLLVEAGVDAAAFTGEQAGIVTTSDFGDAKIVRVEPGRITAAVEAGCVPVVAGFQGVSEDGEITTLGRGGTDLTAIALGHALASEKIDIYTDVSGALSGDPRRIEGAHTVARVSLDEMTELAQNGAKVMHYKAAEFARRTKTPYSIKGLRSDMGTVVDDSFDRHRPVTGVTASERVTWVRAIRGDIEDARARMQLEMSMFERIARAKISIDQVTINQAGICFVVQGDRGNDIRSLLADLNMAVRVREGCSKLSVVGAGMRYEPGVIARIVGALSAANVEIIHCTDSNITVSILVPAADAQRAEQSVHDTFGLEKNDA